MPIPLKDSDPQEMSQYLKFTYGLEHLAHLTKAQPQTTVQSLPSLAVETMNKFEKSYSSIGRTKIVMYKSMSTSQKAAITPK